MPARTATLVARPITERLARVPFHLIATADDGGIAIAYQPTLLVDHPPPPDPPCITDSLVDHKPVPAVVNGRLLQIQRAPARPEA